MRNYKIQIMGLWHYQIINLQSSNNQLNLTKGMNALADPDLNKLVKGYECKIIHISNELEQIRNEKQELTEEHETVKKLLVDSNNELQQKSKELAEKQKVCHRLKQDKEELESIMKKSQRHRKVLYDHLFSEQQVSQVVDKNQLMMQLSTISNQFNQSNFMELQKVITQRNSEVKKISTKYNDLLKDHLKSVYDYQENIRKLKQQIKILERSNYHQLNVEKRLQQKMPKKCEELLLVNRTLEQKVAVMVEKIKMDEDMIRRLNKEIRQKSESLTRCPSPFANDAYTETQSPALIYQNNQLKKQVREQAARFEALGNAFPNILQSEAQINSLLQKHNRVHELQATLNTQAAKLSALEHELQKTKEDSAKHVEKMKLNKTQFDHNERLYKQILAKLRDFFILVNPHYQCYDFEQLNLTEKEEELLRKANSQETALKAQLTTFGDKINQLTNTVQSKKIELQKLRTALEEQTKKTAELKSINELLQKGIKEKSSHSASETENKYLANILKIFNKLQDERNSLALQLRNESVKNISLTFELSRLADQESIHTETMMEMPIKHFPEVNVARPSVVYLQFSQNFSDINIKLLDLQRKIEQGEKNHEFLVKQLTAQHESLVDNLKEKITKLEMEKKELIEKSSSAKLAPAVQEQHSQNSHSHQTVQIPLQSFHDHSMLDMEDQVLAGEGIDEPLNTVAAQSVEEMAKLLRGHEINSKNIIEAYNNLKAKLQNLQATRNQATDQTQIESMKAMIAEYANQIAILKTRIRQTDQNLVVLENALAAKNEELQTIQANSNKQIQHLKNLVNSLQQQAEMLRKQDWMQSSPLHKNTSKRHFPEEIEYLVGLVMQLKTMLRSASQKKAEEQKQMEQQEQTPVNKDKLELSDVDQSQLKQLIESGRLVSALEEAIRRLEDENNSGDS